MLVLDCFIPVNGALLEELFVCTGTSPDYGWSYAFLSAAIVMVIGLILFNNETFLGPIGDSPLLDQTSSKEQLKLLFM
jgi:POT family proton-dependent oligopeptide transporter